jgi:methylaspartate mutase sigma subunit
MKSETKSKGTLVTGVIGEDVHIVGIKIVEHALRSAGYKIVSLGAQVPQQEFVNAAKETGANAILISSLGGHAQVHCEGLRDKCVEAGLKDVRLYVGGQLVIGEQPWSETEKEFRAMGFDRVYPKDVEIPQVINDLAADIKQRKKRGFSYANQKQKTG